MILKKLLLIIVLFHSLSANIESSRFSHIFDIFIENKSSGNIYVKKDDIQYLFGKVIIPVSKYNTNGFTASKWANIGTITAAAVNAIHIKVGHNQKKDRGIIFSILPKEQLNKKFFKSYLDPTSSIYTNIKAGRNIFGGKWSPIVNNPVFVKTNDKFILIPSGYQPKIGDIFKITVLIPSPYPKEIVFENRFNGKITVKYLNGTKEIIGRVNKPVLGIGRFIGTKYSPPARIRANHTGVIDISTSPYRKTGGFQIIPSEHGESKEMLASKTKTQWMVVSPLKDSKFPLFSGYIIPRYYEIQTNQKAWKKDISNRTLVQCKYKSKNKWVNLPILSVNPRKPLPRSMNTVLKNISHIRILLPIINRNFLINKIKNESSLIEIP